MFNIASYSIRSYHTIPTFHQSSQSPDFPKASQSISRGNDLIIRNDGTANLAANIVRGATPAIKEPMQANSQRIHRGFIQVVIKYNSLLQHKNKQYIIQQYSINQRQDHIHKHHETCLTHTYDYFHKILLFLNMTKVAVFVFPDYAIKYCLSVQFYFTSS